MKTISIVLLLAVFASCSPKLSPDRYWSEKRWILTEMKEVPVQLSGTRRDAYVEFSWTDQRYNGNGGCNQFSGNYTLDKKQLSFGEITSTKMSCPDIEFENTFFELLRQVDHYEMVNDRLLLKDGRKVVLAFQAK